MADVYLKENGTILGGRGGGDIMLSTAMCKRFEPIIRGKTRNMMVGSYEEWEDVVGDIYLSLCRAVNTGVFKGRCDIGSFLFVILQRRVMDFVRVKYKRVRIEEALVSRTQEEFCPSPEEIFIEKEQREMLLGFISRLAGWRQRQIMGLYLSGESLSEIARMLNLSIGSVYECYRRAVEHFRNFMKGG